MKKHHNIGWIILCFLLGTGWACHFLVLHFAIDAKQDIIDDRSEQLGVDNGMLQLIFEEAYERDDIEITEVTVSAYSSTRDQTDSTPHTTASGANVMIGQIAVSRDLFNKGLKFGSVVYLKGLGVFRVEDVMAPRWTNRVDIWCMDKTACKLFGKRDNVDLIWIREMP